MTEIQCSAFLKNGLRLTLKQGAANPLPSSLLNQKASFFKGASEKINPGQKKKINFRQKPFSLSYQNLTGQFELFCSKVQFSGQLQYNPAAKNFFRLNLEGHDEVVGLGAASGNLLKNNSSLQILNLDTLFASLDGVSYSSFPLVIIKRQQRFFAVYLHITLPMRCQVSRSVVFEVENNNENFDFDLFFFEGSLPEILQSYTKVSGQPFLPPAWSLGFHQSRWSYRSARRVMQVAERFRHHDLPLDAIHLDIHYMQGYRLFTFHKRRFKHPEKLNQQLAQLGVKTVAINDVGVKLEKGYSTCEEMLSRRLYCTESNGRAFVGKQWAGKSIFPDFTIEETRQWWAGKHHNLFAAGVAGIWNDMNDPVLFLGKNYDPLEVDIRHQGGSHRSVRNVYATLQAQSVSQAFERQLPGRRPFILTRSAFAGIQKYSALWTGDNYASWQQLHANLHMVINLGLVGVPFVGADTGGFTSKPGLLGLIKLRRKKELFARWMQLGSLMPFFRAHTALLSIGHEPYCFGSRVMAVCRKYMKRRYRLLPYLYQQFYQAHKTGSPVVRPLAYHYPGLSLRATENQFMVGEDILAAPVMRPKQKQLAVLFPGSDPWYDFETAETHGASQTAIVEVKLETMPFFIRAGTLLPTCPAGRNAEESLHSGLVLEYFPGPSRKLQVIIDDGQSTDKKYLLLRVNIRRVTEKKWQFLFQFENKGYNTPFDDFEFRFPLFLQMRKKKKRLTAQVIDLRSEDRKVMVHSIKLPLQNTAFTLCY